MDQDISGYRFATNCYVRRGTVTVNGQVTPVVLLVDPDLEVAFPVPLVNVDRLVAQLYIQRAAAGERPVSQTDFNALL